RTRDRAASRVENRRSPRRPRHTPGMPEQGLPHSSPAWGYPPGRYNGPGRGKVSAGALGAGGPAKASREPPPGGHQAERPGAFDAGEGLGELVAAGGGIRVVRLGLGEPPAQLGGRLESARELVPCLPYAELTGLALGCAPRLEEL